MLTAVIVLAVLGTALGVGCAVLLLRRGKLLASEAALRAEGSALATARDQAVQALERAGADLNQVRAALAKAEAEAAEMRRDAANQRQEREGDRASAEQRLREAVEATRRELRAQIGAFEEAKQQYEKERAASQQSLRDTFGSLAAEALKQSSAELLKAAKENWGAERTRLAGEQEKQKLEVQSIVAPISETLKKTDEKLSQMQQQWAMDRGTISEQVRAVGEAGTTLRAETVKLVRALSRPEVRGAWGEWQLKRVAELAGMTAYCDFAEQVTAPRPGDEGAIRPDMVVRLPNDRVIIVDAKTNTMEYLEAARAEEPSVAEAHLENFARHVAEQVTALSRKRYWSGFDGAIDFTVMFVPGDQFLDAALVRRPGLMEAAAAANVILVTPATLIGLLRAVALGWREKHLAAEAAELLELGRTLHERARVAMEKASDLGGALETAVRRYNEFVGSYKSRLEPTLRRFEDAGARGAKDLPEVAQVEVVPRLLGEGPTAPGQSLLHERGA